MSTRVLVVDDEPQILRALRVILRNAGFQVDAADTGDAAIRALTESPPDAMVLDLVLPDGSGVDVVKDLRRWSGLPVLVLSAVGDEREKVRALDAGADDYVTKPFGAEELTARLRAEGWARLLGGAPVVEAHGVRIDLAARQVTKDGAGVHLTPIEFDLLRVLAQHQGKLVTHRQLLHDVWGPGYDGETHYLRVHVAHIRSKLGDGLIATEPGVGYRLTDS